MHSNSHVQPCASLAGRPSLVAYYGWVSNHGYNANERLGDRDYLMEHALSREADERSLGIIRKYGVRYILGEGSNVGGGEQGSGDAFLGGALWQAFKHGRYTVYEVQQ